VDRECDCARGPGAFDRSRQPDARSIQRLLRAATGSHRNEISSVGREFKVR
jgi:hypothetical protein